MKNLLYIGNNLSKIGKTETTIESLSKLLRFEGYTVFVFSNKRNKVFRLLEMFYAIVKYSNKVDYVLIDTYSTSNFYYAYLCSQLCRLLKLKYIPILHGGNLPYRLKNNPMLSRAIFNYAYKNISPSVYIQTEFEKQGYSNLICISNSIEINKYLFNQRNLEAVNMLWVRSFSEIYNPLLAIEILNSLIDANIKASLCMVGPDNDGSLKKTKNYAKELGLEVTFTGKLLKSEWIELSSNYNVFINTTNFDNMPVSIIEAMALGLPVISTNVGGMPFLIDNKVNGVLVNPNQPELFVDAIKKLQSNPDETSKMILKARKKVEQFDWNFIKKQWIRVLQ